MRPYPVCWDRTEEFRDIVRLNAPPTAEPHNPCSTGSSPDDAFQDAHLSRHPRGYRPVATAPSFWNASGGDEEEDVTDMSSPSSLARLTCRMEQELSDTVRQIAQVEQLVKQRGIFEDRTAEIQATTYAIRQSLVRLSAQLDSAERTALSVPTASSNGHVASHYRSVTQSLRTRLGDATMQLKRILELRAQAMKSQEDRRGFYSHSALPRPSHIYSDASGGADSHTGGQHSSSGLEGDALLQHRSLQMFAPPSDQQYQPVYETARAEAIDSVQHMISELAQIFNRVATLVTAQEELAVRIEDDVTSAFDNLRQGEAHLTKYLHSISSHRSLILKVFGILLFFIVFFIIFLS